MKAKREYGSSRIPGLLLMGAEPVRRGGARALLLPWCIRDLSSTRLAARNSSNTGPRKVLVWNGGIYDLGPYHHLE